MIGIDTLKIYVPGYRLKRNSEVALDRCENIPENNRMRVHFTDGSIENFTKMKFNTKDNLMQVNFQSMGSLTAKVSVPKVINANNIDILGLTANQRVYEYIFDSLSDAGVHFNHSEAINSRIDITRNLDLRNEPSEYFHLMSMIPRSSVNFSIGNTRYTGHKSFMVCAYDKLGECQAKRQEIPADYQGKNLIRIESRFLKGSKLRTDSIKSGVNLQDVNCLQREDQFRKVQGLYVSYMQRLFMYEYKTLVGTKKNTLIIQIQALKKAGFTPLKTLSLTSQAYNFFSPEEISFIFYPANEGYAKQKRYRFKKEHELDLLKAKENELEKVMLFDGLYNEIRVKAIENC